MAELPEPTEEWAWPRTDEQSRWSLHDVTVEMRFPDRPVTVNVFSRKKLVKLVAALAELGVPMRVDFLVRRLHWPDEDQPGRPRRVWRVTWVPTRPLGDKWPIDVDVNRPASSPSPTA